MNIKEMTRKELKKEALKCMQYLLNANEPVPLEDNRKFMDTDMEKRFIAKNDDVHYLYVLDTGSMDEYSVERITIKEAHKMINDELNKKDKVGLREEIVFWKEYSLSVDGQNDIVLTSETLKDARESLGSF